MTQQADYVYHYDSPLGGMTMAADGNALTGLWFDGQKFFAAALSPDPVEKRLPVFRETERWLDLYFSGREPAFTPVLNPKGTAFRMAVWKLLRTIPYGQTMTYGAVAGRLAEQTGRRVSARAVGGAVGYNPISLIIPCHRVIGSSGNLTGYAGGMDRKRHLLQLEGIQSPR